MRTISLTPSKEALVSDRDYAALKQIKWHAHKSPLGNYYARGRLQNRRIYMHVLVAKRMGHDNPAILTKAIEYLTTSST